MNIVFGRMKFGRMGFGQMNFGLVTCNPWFHWRWLVWQVSVSVVSSNMTNFPFSNCKNKLGNILFLLFQKSFQTLPVFYYSSLWKTCKLNLFLNVMKKETATSENQLVYKRSDVMILNDFLPVKEDLKNTYEILSYSNELWRKSPFWMIKLCLCCLKHLRN